MERDPSDALQIPRAELSPFFFFFVFLLVLTFADLLKPAQSALWFSCGELQGKAAYTSCFTQVFPRPVPPSLGAIPGAGKWRIRRNISSA